MTKTREQLVEQFLSQGGTITRTYKRPEEEEKPGPFQPLNPSGFRSESVGRPLTINFNEDLRNFLTSLRYKGNLTKNHNRSKFVHFRIVGNELFLGKLRYGKELTNQPTKVWIPISLRQDELDELIRRTGSEGSFGVIHFVWNLDKPDIFLVVKSRSDSTTQPE